MPSKERIDVLLVEQGYFPSREKAKAAIMAGLVYVDQQRADKAGMKIPEDAKLSVKGREHPYVGRGGLKLEKAIHHFNLNFSGKTALDIGASTGGFTDCALQHGASFVYAIDVGYNQLAWSLRTDHRVAVMERMNFRYIQKDDLTGPDPDIAMIDVSFISLKLILPPLANVMTNGGSIIALIKPQFEAGKDKVGKSGVVRDTETHKEVLQEVLTFAAELGFVLRGLTYSPVQGGEGNTEFLAYWTYRLELNAENEQKRDVGQQLTTIDTIVKEAGDHFSNRSSDS